MRPARQSRHGCRRPALKAWRRTTAHRLGRAPSLIACCSDPAMGSRACHRDPLGRGPDTADEVRPVAALAPLTLRATKQGLLRIRPEVAAADDLVTACYTSRDFREAVEAFVQRRKPRWEGR